MEQSMGRKREARPTAATWRLSRSGPLEETVQEATKRTVKVYEEALRKLAKY